MTKAEQLNYFAGCALQALISKMPLLDREGTLGSDKEDIPKVKSEIAESAWEYAQYMVLHSDKAHQWVSENFPYAKVD